MLTLVFTDLADSTALKGRHGDSAVDALLVRHREHVERLAVECSGRIIDWAGDGCFLTFEISSAGVIFALRLQQVHAEELDLPGVRVGIHHGEVTETPATGGGPPRVGGLTVDLASRICGLAKPGQVLMSSAVYNSARQRLGVDTFGQPVLWQTHGTYAIKGFDEPLDIGEAALEGLAPLEAPTSGDKAKLIRRAKHPASHTKPTLVAWKSGRRLVPVAVGVAILLASIGVAYLAARSENKVAAPSAAPIAADANAPITKIAVLPFKNISGDPQQEYFVDGMTEALISELAKIKSIKVISRTSSMYYKDSDMKAQDIARELGVDGLVEGSAMKAGNEVRITAQLIRAATDDHLWAENYTETLDNVLKLQAKVALAITAEIKAVVTPDERIRVNAAKTVNIDAYELYVQARHLWSQRSPDGIRRAGELFKKSLEIDPSFALGHAGLADAYFSRADYYLTSSAEALPLARQEAEKALALDPALGEAYATLAMIDMTENWNWKTAEAAYLKSIELSPNYATAHQWYGGYLNSLGRHAEAADQLQQAYQLDPASPIIATSYAQSFSYLGQNDEFVKRHERIVGQFPDNSRVLMGLARVYLAVGRNEEALQAAERAVAADPDSVIAPLQMLVCLARLGRTDEARRLLEENLSHAGSSTVPSVYVARAYAALNDPDRALEWLNKACDVHDSRAWQLKFFPEFDALESDPRYQALLRRMNFPE